MDLVVLKFGGSSVADNIKLNVVAEKIKKFYNENHKIIVVVSAQGKTTDNLIKEAKNLASMPNERELDVLVSTGEQVTIAKLAILLNRLDMPAISLTGWQAGIYTNCKNQNAIIKDISVTRIEKELENGKIVIVAGFQGINEKNDITTLGRGGSDTTAVAIAAKFKATKCYIFSDVDGVYSADPNKTKLAKKINQLSYVEMLDIANEGAKVLHNRCVELSEKFKVPLVAKSTFNENKGTIIDNTLEGGYVKSIVKNDNLIFAHITSKTLYKNKFNIIYNYLIKKELEIKHFVNGWEKNLNISFTIPKEKKEILIRSLEETFPELKIDFTEISRISIIGNGMLSDNTVFNNIINTIEKYNLEIKSMDVNENKISIMFDKVISDEILDELHKSLI